MEAELNDELMEYGITKDKLISILIKRGLLSRHEKITDDEKPQYIVKFKLHKKDFENKVKKIHIQYCEENTPDIDIELNENFNGLSVFKNEDEEKEKIMNDKVFGSIYRKRGGIMECDGGGAVGGGGGSFGADNGGTSTFSSMGEAPILPLGKQPIKKKKIYNPKNETKNPKNIILTEAQIQYLKEFFDTKTLGDKILSEEDSGYGEYGAVGDYTANGLQLKKNDPAYNHKNL